MNKKALISLIVIAVIVLFILSLNPIIDLMRSKAAGPLLSISPATLSVVTGNSVSVDILLDTTGTSVDGVDVYSLRFNPNILQVQDDDVVKAGIQITSLGLLPVTTANTVDNTAGTIKFSQLTDGGTTFNGSGKLATVHFTAINSGISNISFDFSPGSTVDSNVASGGADQLAVVINAVATVSSSPAPTPTPSPTTPPKFQIGQQVQTTALVNVRTSPGGGKPTGKQKLGAIGAVLAGPTLVSGTPWWSVNFNTGADGWVVETYLK